MLLYLSPIALPPIKRELDAWRSNDGIMENIQMKGNGRFMSEAEIISFGVNSSFLMNDLSGLRLAAIGYLLIFLSSTHVSVAENEKFIIDSETFAMPISVFSCLPTPAYPLSFARLMLLLPNDTFSNNIAQI